MKRTTVFKQLCLALAVASGSADAAAANTPQEALQDFLDWHHRTSPSGYPGPADQTQLRTLLTGELFCLLKATATYSAKYQKTFPGDKPPYVEGDLFLSSVFDRPDKVEVESLRLHDTTATALVHFAYDAEFSWRDRFQLRLENGDWRVADIDRLGPRMNRQGQFSFGGQAGSLRASLYTGLDRNKPYVGWHRREIAPCKAQR